jgi:site-specific DNA-methyltransferase (adenine-specific)
MLSSELSMNHEVKAGIPVPWGSVLEGDCLGVTDGLPAGILDLVYIDPPFFTNREHLGSRRNARESASRFEDRWQGGLHDYLAWLEARIRGMHRLLKPRGVFLLHLDWHAVHYAKVLCDGIFGMDRFQNELIWYYQTGGASRGRFSRKHDNILMYSLDDGFYFDGKGVAIPRTAKAMKRARSGKGARIAADDTHKNPDDVILVPALNPMAKERNGYPTQKPVALLEMLITALCPPAGAVGDFFCGSGTTLVAAEKLGRKWIGCDASEAAVELARRRVAAG